MRIFDSKENIDYNDTRDFFSNRAKKYNPNNPYTVTMYQDNHPQIAEKRNELETQILKPLLCLDKHSRILDIACGIGRWSDAITENIDAYVGIDFCKDLVKIANQRNTKENRHFFTCDSTNISSVTNNYPQKFNRILLIGSILYLNDSDLTTTLTQVREACTDSAIICVRDPIGITNRLTLKEQFSEELNDNYNAIYRTRDEYLSFFEKCLISEGFKISKEGWLFEDDILNNRKETAQYYFILTNRD